MEDNMGLECGRYGREEKYTYKVLAGQPEMKRPLPSLAVDGSIILK
jgi:hypothetical protein